MATYQKTRRPVKRSIQVVRRHRPGMGYGQLRITCGKLVQDYLYVTAPAAGGVGFRLLKCDADGCPLADLPEGERAYDVLLHEDGDSCDCKGFQRHGHCKHILATSALVTRDGQKPGPVEAAPPAPRACNWCAGTGTQPCGDAWGNHWVRACRCCNGTGVEVA